MADTGVKYGSAMVGSTGFANTGNLFAADNTGASRDFIDGDFDCLTVKTFSLGLPADATIDGVKIEAGYDFDPGFSADGDEILFRAGIYLSGDSDPSFTSLPGTYEEYTLTGLGSGPVGVLTFGGATAKFGRTLNYSNTSSSSFGVYLGMQYGASDNKHGGSLGIDYLRVTVYYTAAGGGGGGSVTHTFFAAIF